MGVIHNFLRTNYRPGEWIGRLCSPQERNRQNNIFQDCKGVWCRIDKPVNQEGRGWKIIIDGTSDIYDGTQPPWASASRGSISMDATGSATDPVQFVSPLFETNPDVLSSTDTGEGVFTTIDVGLSGIYQVNIQVNCRLPIDVASSVASVAMYDDSDELFLTWELSLRDVAGISGGTNKDVRVQQSASRAVWIAAGKVLHLECSNMSDFLYIYWTISLIEAYTP